MAYNSAHTGPEIDAAVQLLGDIQEAKDATAADRQAVTGMASTVATQASQVSAQASQVSSNTSVVLASASAVEADRAEVEQNTGVVLSAKTAAQDAGAAAVAAQGAIEVIQQSVSQSQIAAEQSEQSAGDSASAARADRDQVELLAQQTAEDSASAAESAAAAAAVVTGGTATLIPEPGKIPLAKGDGKIDEGWLPPEIARVSSLTAVTEQAEIAIATANAAEARTDRFLDPADEPPQLRDSGLPLQFGDVYFNTVTQSEYIYTDEGWQANDSLAAISELEARIVDTPEAGATPKAGSDGKIDEGWLPPAIARNSQIVSLSEDLDESKVYQAAGAGSIPIDVKQKLSLEPISVEEYGAVGGSVDDSLAFQMAVDALPARGGSISATRPSYTVVTPPVMGTKSVTWIFGPDTIITGQETFPKFATNGSCSPSGTYVRSQRAAPTIDGAASFAMGIESIQPASDNNSGYGALYVGAQLNADGNYSINSAINAVATANPGSSGNVFGIEIDVATFATPGKGTQFGLLVSGAGGNDVTFGIRINRHGTSEKYLYGIAIASARIGMFIDDNQGGFENGLVLGNPPARYANNMIQAMQISNGGTVLLMQRKSNTGPTGNFISAINANNTQQLFAVDVNGNLVSQRLEAPTARLTGAPSAQAAGQMSIGAQTSASASAGGITPPTKVEGYIVIFIGPTQYKVPYYAA